MKPIRLAIFVTGGGTNCENIIRYFQNDPDVVIPIVVSSREDAYALVRAERLGVPTTVITRQQLANFRRLLNDVFVEPSLLRYIAEIVQQTRQSKVVFLGASPRAAVAMLNTSKAFALLQGRDYVTPDDIQFVTPSILQHRLILTAEAEMEGHTPLKVARRLMERVEVPK